MHQRLPDFLKAVAEFPLLEKVALYSTNGYKNKRDFFSLLPGAFEKTLRTKWLTRSWKNSADSSLLKYHGLLKSVLKGNNFNVIMLENLSTLNAVALIRRYNSKACIIYDAHNIDSNLAADKLKRGVITTTVYDAVKRNESSLYKKVDAALVCSKSDLEGYEKLNAGKLRASVVPNGVRLGSSLCDEAVDADHPTSIIFCGTLNYYPNAEGLLWFYHKVWPLVKHKLPALRMIVIGSGNASPELAPLQIDPTVSFEGRVADVKEYYRKAALSIVPLKQGSGTRLKILESMSLGVPVISTSIGAEGIEYTKDQNIIIADTEMEFANRLINLVLVKEERVALKLNARLLVEENYDWDIIGNRLQHQINEMCLN
jgi:glycosyltransferase involved in cell wall biosynthesis